MENMDADESGTDTINVVPLADLSLVLLIIMMLLGPVALSSMIRVQTPNLEKTKAIKKQQKTPDPLLVKITSEGIFLNNNKVDSVDFLGEQIAIKLRDEADRPVIVSADDNIQVGDVVHVLDVAKQSGADQISLLKGSKGAS